MKEHHLPPRERRSQPMVDNNGLLSFSLPISQYIPQPLPLALGNPFLAVFWADINNQLAGDIFYRRSTDPALLSRATSDIQTYFRDFSFTAQWAFVVTWHRVPYYGSSGSRLNTFQAVISGGANKTYLLYNYADIQWPALQGNTGPWALAGLNSGYNTGFYTIPGSLTRDIANVSTTSNINVTGRWAFRVDRLRPEDVNGILDNSTEDTLLLNSTTPRPTTTSSPSPLSESSANLYSYGQEIDSLSPRSDDGSSPMIPLSAAVPLFGRNYTYVYVNNNGLLSFRLPVSQYTPQPLPLALGNPLLPVFWADINNQMGGAIYYRQSTDPTLLSQATSDIRTYFGDVRFTAQLAFVATWHQVPYYGSNTNRVNTFQVVLATNGNQTYLLYNYANIQWPTVTVGPLSLAGINSGSITGYYTLPGSLSAAMGNIATTSNVNVTGRWAFRVDRLRPEDVNGILDNSTDVTPTTVPTTTTISTTVPALLSSALMYPYGSSIDTLTPRSDDGGSPLISLNVTVPLFGRNYSSMYVNNNGLLSFRLPIGQFTPQQLPMAFGNPFLAVFWADVNNQIRGDIYYRRSTDPSLLARATSDVRTYFPSSNFTAQWVFVATWYRVAYYGSYDNRVDTFQAVLVTDGAKTFLLYNYEDLQWPGLLNNGLASVGPPALAGINSGYTTGYYTLPRSLTFSINQLSLTSNVNVTGRWAFRVDKPYPEDISGNIDESGDLNSTTVSPFNTYPAGLPFENVTTIPISPNFRIGEPAQNQELASSTAKLSTAGALFLHCLSLILFAIFH